MDFSLIVSWVDVILIVGVGYFAYKKGNTRGFDAGYKASERQQFQSRFNKLESKIENDE